MAYTVVLVNGPELAGTFRTMARGKWMQSLFTLALNDSRRYLDVYATELQGTDYVRRGNQGGLKSEWFETLQFSSRHAVVEFGNTMPGAEYVQSAERQAAVHRGRWRRDTEALDVAMKSLDNGFARTIESAFGRQIIANI